MRSDSFDNHNHSLNLLTRPESIKKKININSIKVEPTEFMLSKEFILSLNFPYVNENYLNEIHSQIGHYIYFFKVTYTEGEICESPTHH